MTKNFVLIGFNRLKVAPSLSSNIRPENWVKIFPGKQDQHKNNKKGNMPEIESYVTALDTRI